MPARELPHVAIQVPRAHLLCNASVEQRTATKLARLLTIDGSRVSRVIVGLAERGLLRRQRLRSDRCIVMPTPSEAGLELVAAVGDVLRGYSVDRRRGVSQDGMSVFLSVASRIVANHQALRESGP